MLQTSFKNYDEFKELFVRKNNDGYSVRRNGVLLDFLKSKEVHKFLRDNYPDVTHWGVKTMGGLYSSVCELVRRESRRWYNDSPGPWYRIKIMGKDYFSNMYETDGRNGVCLDGDTKGYRYINREREGRVFKMKIGKMYRHLIDLTRLVDVLPESVKLYVCEELTREWEAYAAAEQPSNLTLHVDDDFASIYDSGDVECDGRFGSCMQGGENWRFYRDAVKAKAAYLTKAVDEDEDVIVARCIVFTEVERMDTGEIIRVAERQYSSDCDEGLQRLLIKRLYDGGYIDWNKKTGAGCGNATAFVDKNGNDMSHVGLSIECNLDDGDYMSYQDSFKWYDYNSYIAYNKSYYDYTDKLDSTDEYFEPDEDLNWDSWHEENTRNEVQTVYYHGREYTCDEDRMDDFYYVEYGEGRHEYHHSDDVTYCDDIEGYVLNDDATYSDYLQEYYYDTNEMEEREIEQHEFDGEVYAEYDEEWYDKDEVMELIDYVSKDLRFSRTTIFRDTLMRMVEDKEAVLVPGTNFAYTMDVLEELAA